MSGAIFDILKGQKEQSMPITLLRITPEMALEFLKFMIPNRAVNQSHVDNLRRAMDSGAWYTKHLLGDPIAFDAEGRLLNGQHRMRAIVRHGNPVEMWVETTPRTDEVADLTDCVTRGRRLSDMLQMSGVSNARAVASMLKVVWQFHTQKLVSGAVPMKNWDARTQSALKDVVVNTPAFKENIKKIVAVANRPDTQPGRFIPSGLAMFLMMHNTESIELFDDIGREKPAIHPVAACVRKTITKIVNESQKNTRLGFRTIPSHSPIVYYAVISGFNDYTSGRNSRKTAYNVLDEKVSFEVPNPTPYMPWPCLTHFPEIKSFWKID